jgi:RNA polymerase sigma factor (sigma-70 family)
MRKVSRPAGAIVKALSARLTAALVRDLFRSSKGERWGLSVADFAAALEASVAHGFPGAEPAPGEVRAYAERLHLDDLALAQACLLGHGAAWDHFILTHRPVLYRAADALDPSGGARELADGLYGDLYGVKTSGEGRPLFSYFHGRSTLATWLRAVLSQRVVDSMRVRARSDVLPDDARHRSAAPAPIDPDRHRLVPLVDRALRAAIAGLPDRDRLRLRSYHVAGLTLAQIGRITGEHEATVSRHLARTRREVRETAQKWLHGDGGLTPEQIARALELAAEDVGEFDLQQVFDPDVDRKESS